MGYVERTKSIIEDTNNVTVYRVKFMNELKGGFSMKKNVLLVLSVLMVVLQISFVHAAEVNTDLISGEKQINMGTIRWNNTHDVTPMISANASSVDIGLYINAESDANISGRLYLEKYNGSRWIRVTSWSVKGKGSITMSKSYKVSGGKYRTRISAKIGTDRVNLSSVSCNVE